MLQSLIRPVFRHKQMIVVIGRYGIHADASFGQAAGDCRQEADGFKRGMDRQGDQPRRTLRRQPGAFGILTPHHEGHSFAFAEDEHRGESGRNFLVARNAAENEDAFVHLGLHILQQRREMAFARHEYIFQGARREIGGLRFREPAPHDGHGFLLSADDDFADLDHRGLVGIVRDISHDLLGMRPEAGLEGLDRVTEDVTHSDIGCGSPGCATGHALVDRVGLARIAHAGFHERHMLVAVVIVIEAPAWRIGIHYAYLDHRRALRCDVRRLAGNIQNLRQFCGSCNQEVEEYTAIGYGALCCSA